MKNFRASRFYMWWMNRFNRFIMSTNAYKHCDKDRVIYASELSCTRFELGVAQQELETAHRILKQLEEKIISDRKGNTLVRYRHASEKVFARVEEYIGCSGTISAIVTVCPEYWGWQALSWRGEVVQRLANVLAPEVEKALAKYRSKLLSR